MKTLFKNSCVGPNFLTLFKKNIYINNFSKSCSTFIKLSNGKTGRVRIQYVLYMVANIIPKLVMNQLYL
jgi:hypothetical protein